MLYSIIIIIINLHGISKFRDKPMMLVYKSRIK